MSYRFKGQQVIINGVRQTIVPSPLPSSPANGVIAIDEADGKLKVYNETKARWVVLGDAEDVKFNNASNGFTANQTQAAIEEARNSSIGIGRFSIITAFNGTIGNQWLGYNELIPGNTTPILIPVKCKLREVTFAWNSTITILGGIITVTTDVDGRFEIYKNGFDAGSIIFTRTFSNSGGLSVSSGLDINLNAGDFIVGRWIDLGGNPSDAAFCYFLQPTL